MATMIEKMARAIAGWTPNVESWTNCCDNPKDAETLQAIYYTKARAALEALLEPSEAMVEAGECGPYPHNEEHPGFGDPMPRQIYKAMIQVALEEK